MKNILLTGGILLWSSIAALANSSGTINNSRLHLFHKTTKADRQENRELRKEKELITPTYQTEQHFLIDFPGATNVTWFNHETEEATFTYNGQQISAFYDNDNDLIGTVTDASYADLPKPAFKQIERYYKGYTPKKVIFFDDNEYNDSIMNLYGSPFDGEDNYFVEMQKDNKTIILQVTMGGDVAFFQEMR